FFFVSCICWNRWCWVERDLYTREKSKPTIGYKH
ncbi:hypothetical protein MIMGU_mgv11b0209582mg, partial [Erythranthe guttata]